MRSCFRKKNTRCALKIQLRTGTSKYIHRSLSSSLYIYHYNKVYTLYIYVNIKRVRQTTTTSYINSYKPAADQCITAVVGRSRWPPRHCLPNRTTTRRHYRYFHPAPWWGGEYYEITSRLRCILRTTIYVYDYEERSVRRHGGANDIVCSVFKIT